MYVASGYAANHNNVNYVATYKLIVLAENINCQCYSSKHDLINMHPNYDALIGIIYNET